MMNKTTLGLAAALIAGTQATDLNAAVLDDFARVDANGTGLMLLSVPETISGPYVTSESVEMLPGTFGDTRTFTLEDSSADGRGVSNASILGIGGILAMDTGSNSEPSDGSLDIVYDDFSDVDVTADGSAFFEVVVAAIDGEFDFKLTLQDVGNNASSANVTLNSVGASYIDLSVFNGAVDLTSIETITASIVNDTTAADVSLDRIGFTSVPEPTSLALLGLGGLLIARRRR